MLELKVKVDRTKLKLVSQPAPFTEGLKNYAKIVFDFHEDWASLGKSAMFKRVLDQHSVTVQITNNECVVPYEVFTYPQVELSVRGSGEDSVITTNILRIDVKRSVNEGSAPAEPTDDVYDQIMAAAGEAIDAVEDLEQRANSGEFKGEKGDPGTSIVIKGKYDTYEELVQDHPTASEGDCYTVNGVLYVYTQQGWIDAGQFKGDKGDPGEDGTDGTTPTIGANGNWYLGDTDTGKPSQGATGAPGADGEDGVAATIEVGTVTTGAAGSSVVINNRGTSTAAILDFTIPRGDKGETGDGGVPTEGTTGQVLKKTETGTEWADLPDIMDADEIRELINAPAVESLEDGVVLKTPDASDVATLSISGGGTGATTAKAAQYNICSEMTEATTDGSDEALFTFTATNPSASTGVFIKRPGARVWNWIASKIRSVFGFNSSNVLPVANGGTGANNTVDARNNLMSDGTIYSEADLNDFTNNGVYIISEITSGNILNKPNETKDAKGHLIVLKMNNSHIIQIFYAASTDDGVYKRNMWGLNVWTDWVEITSKETSANYLPLTGGTLTGALNLNTALGLSSGGTGQTTAKGAQHALLSNMNSASDTPIDSSDVVFAYDASTANNGAVFKRPLSTLWTWIKSKADDVYAAASHTHTVDNVGIKRGTKTFNASGEFASFDESVSLDFNPTNYMILCSVMPTNGAADPSQVPTVQGGGAYKKTTNSFSVAGYCTVSGSHTITWVAIPLS